MRESLFNGMNSDIIANAVGKEIQCASTADILIPMICKGLSSKYSHEDFSQIRSMGYVNAYQDEMLGRPFTLSLSDLSLEEMRIQQLSGMLDTLEYKEERYMGVTNNELAFYDGMVDIVTGESGAALEADTAFGKGTREDRAGGYLEKGAIKRFALTIKKLVISILKLFVGLISNFLNFIGKAIGLLSKFFLWMKGVIDGGAERVGFKQAYVPKALESRIKRNSKSKIKEAGKDIASVLRAANHVDVTDEQAFMKFREIAGRVFPGDLDKQSAGEYLKTLVDPTEADDSKETTEISADEFISLLKRVDSSHSSAMKKVQKEATSLTKTLKGFERENDKQYNEVMSDAKDSTVVAAAKAEYKKFNERINFLRKIVQICTMVEDTIVKEELAVMKLLQSAKPKTD